MREAVIDGAAGLAVGWRAAARVLLADGVPPDRVAWRVAGEAQGALSLLGTSEDAGDTDDGGEATPHARDGDRSDAGRTPARVPRRFLDLLARVACHRDASRWDRLYRVLWRLTHGEPHLLDVRTDPEVTPLFAMAKAVDREVHKLHAFVRFRVVEEPDGPTYLAWFEPAHDVLALAAPLFERRFASMRWAILTPDASVRWDGAALAFGPGAPRPEAGGDDAESLWKTYYAHVFNPARAKPGAMRAEMPLRYWRNLPEAPLIPTLLREAPGRVRAMIERARAEAERAATTAPPRHRSSDAPDAPPGVARRGGREDVPQQPAGHAPGTTPAPLDIDGCAVRVGTASWTDPTLLVPGLFYPHGVDTPEARLRHYASRFPLVEVDSTYYALPTAKVARLWAERTPDGFTFDVKAHAILTGHPVETARLPRALRDLLPAGLAGATRVRGDALPTAAQDAAWRLFLDALAPLRDAGRLGTLLLQFPRWFTPSRAAADRLRAARERLADWYGAGLVAAVELRHRDWYAPRLRARTLALLERLDFAHVVVDAPPGHESSVPLVPVATHPRLAVVRLHGRRTETWERPVSVVSERYRYRYSAAELEDLVVPVLDVARQTQGVHVVFNNCHADYGTTNADEIAALIRGRDALRRALV